ncbi:collagenase [Pseudomonas sp. RIT-PI-AD]|uniref:collagenase n=1 Tax=Pseudomonas sp. RIT-PI-AD TaxID=3035294 RepID=UPI0021D8F789|nr:collagenase [Pseudomonas sp. RIT-PI-AD]
MLKETSFMLCRGALLIGLSPFAVAIAQANQAPEVRGHAEYIAAGQPHSSWIWARDADLDRITYAITRQPRSGSLTLDWNTGRYRYTPSAEAGHDSFEYRATDGQAWSDTATVQLTLLAQDGRDGNRAPVASDQTQRVDASREVTGQLIARDADGDALSYAVIDWPRLGSLRLDVQTGQYRYRAARDEDGQDSFAFRVSDGRAHSSILQVRLDLHASGSAEPEPPQDPPLDPTLHSKDDFSPLVREVLDNEFFVETFDHRKAGRLEDVLAAIDFLARQQAMEDPDLDRLLYFLRAYNYYHGLGKADPAQQAMIERALYQVAQMKDLLVYQAASGAVLEGYVVALGGLASGEGSAALVRHLPRLLALLEHLDAVPTLSAENSYADAVFETLNLFDRFGYATGALREAVAAEPRFLEAIARLGSGHNALWRNNDGFIVMNAIEALGKLHGLGDAAWGAQADQAARRVMQAHLGGGKLDDLELKSNFRSYYVEFAYRDDVENSCSSRFEGLCHRFEIGEVLPQTHVCGPTLKVRAQKLDAPHLTQICQSLATQEQDFHRIMQTGNQPVADDYNQALELVVFSSAEQYQKYAGLLYGVSTDNGGIYIEGDPADPANQARFFAYERATPTWQVWNLNHEYVHYLDGRFDQYGPFGHYPLNLTTWWSEGLAEYLAWGDAFPRGLDDISQSEPSQRPGVKEILNLSYESGSSMVYHWSYTLHRYLQTFDPQRHLALAGYLRRNDLAGYQEALAQVEQVHGGYYPAWRDQLIADWNSRPRAARQLAKAAEADSLREARPHASAHQRLLDEKASLARPPLR